MKFDICVLGGCSEDCFFYQNEDGTYNEAPNLVYPGGKGNNQAVAAARAGAKVTIITKLGNDTIGADIIKNLVINHVDTSNIEVVNGLSNDYANIYINANDKDNDIHRFGGAIDSFTPDMVEAHQDAILNSSVVVCQSKCPIEVTEALIDFCEKNNKPIILTPCRPKKFVDRLDLIDRVSIITCNEEECRTIFGTNDLEACVSKYPNKLIVTLGAGGVMYHNGQEIVRIAALDVPVIDTTGAGDTLNGNLAYLLSQGVDLHSAIDRAQYASAMKIQERSAQAGMPTKDELTKFIAASPARKNLGEVKTY